MMKKLIFMVDLLLVNDTQLIVEEGKPGWSALKLFTWSSIARALFG
jgi:hypothetical protein